MPRQFRFIHDANFRLDPEFIHSRAQRSRKIFYKIARELQKIYDADKYSKKECTNLGENTSDCFLKKAKR